VAAGLTGFRVEPLFTSVGASKGLAAAAPAKWLHLALDCELNNAAAWDACHRLLNAGFGADGGPAVEHAEPDLRQQWTHGDPGGRALSLVGEAGLAEPQDPRFPMGSEPLWFRGHAYSQFEEALAQVPAPAAPDRVRVAHLDTGYDPEHKSVPVGLKRALQKNFVDADRPNDATDDSRGLLNNLGHGTGTLGILAGARVGSFTKPYGAAPFVEVIPVRVANSVVVFQNSSIAKGLDYVHSLCQREETRVHVVTMSMGGLASSAWADAINALYEAGVFVVTAAGNNFGNLPTRNIVYPARFNRVIAACGVMADHKPYVDLGLKRMAGNYGPPKKMRTALAACTPNVPWAKRGFPSIVDLDGQGTSAATPQVAAAAALWIQGNKAEWDLYNEGWMKVEAVRQALLGLPPDEHLGRGELRVADALRVPPARAQFLHPEPRDTASFPLLRVITGLGVAETGARQRMLELEALQLSQSAALEAMLEDPQVDPESLSRDQIKQIASAFESHPNASEALRKAMQAFLPPPPAVSLPNVRTTTAVEELHLLHARNPRLPTPTRRRLRVYAYDPSLGTDVETAGINETVLDVQWEDNLSPGPCGEYLEVIDVDPATRCCYAPIDLNAQALLVQDGLRPTETNPQFHQQMVYAVAMRTIEHFERALGRVALWAPRRVTAIGGKIREEYVRRLRIYPHAIRDSNAFYSPDRKALLLGYFTATQNQNAVMPGGLVFSALSHDIIAHETTHALLDGLHVRFREPTNPDVLAFHEGFADLVALFQHFALPEALRHELANARGHLGSNLLMSQLAVQFGLATGRGGALRDAIGEYNTEKKWKPHEPKVSDYESSTEPHARGGVLVGAVFAAFATIYAARRNEVVRLATGGTGVLPRGAISVPLADELTLQASKIARQVLNMCIRALDYCPPVDVTFGDYLRALITADHDLVPNDARRYRVAFVSAFRDRGIYGTDAKSLSEGTLAWEPPPVPLTNLNKVVEGMTLAWDLKSDRYASWVNSRTNACRMHAWLMDASECSDSELDALGLVRGSGPMELGGLPGTLGGIEVHSVRPARRVGPDGELQSDLVVEITQTFRADPPKNAKYRGGCTLLINAATGEARYFIRKRIDRAATISAAQAIQAEEEELANPYFDRARTVAEPFALLHRKA
jgi:hypothetical protein